jgi:hypothetical protein
MRIASILCAFALLATCFGIAAGDTSGVVEQAIDETVHQQVVEEVSALLVEKYIDLDKAKTISKRLQGELKKGTYDDLTSPMAYAQVLEEDLKRFGEDGHLHIWYAPEEAAKVRTLKDEESEEAKRIKQQEYEAARRRNFGIQKIELLPGNIGYMDLRQFMDPQFGGQAVAAAMTLLANADAVIVDLRKNGGGEQTMVQFMISYFVKPETELNGVNYRAKGKFEQSWTLPYVPGGTMYDTPLFVLTGDRTFSGAEDFSYAMKMLKRATIVGVQTRGGAHPIEYQDVCTDFVLMLPIGESVNPISGTAWEGVGVEPDVRVPEEDALAKAQMLALEALVEKTEDEAAQYALKWALDGLRAELDPLDLPISVLKEYEGAYGERFITLKDSVLVYRRTDEIPMFPLSESVFGLQGLDFIRATFVRNDEGEITHLVRMYDDGTRFWHEKTGEAGD